MPADLTTPPFLNKLGGIGFDSGVFVDFFETKKIEFKEAETKLDTESQTWPEPQVDRVELGRTPKIHFHQDWKNQCCEKI